MLPGAGRRAGRDALGMLGGGGPAETPLSAVGRFASDGTASILPAGDATDIDMGKLQSELTVDLCVDVLVRSTRIRNYANFAASVRGRKAVYGTSAPPRVQASSKARPRTVGHVLAAAVCS